MQIKLLGPLEAQINGRSATPTATKPRQVLALLALNAGRIVPVSTLVDEIWGDVPPRSVRSTMQTYILQLRRAIRRASAAAGEGADPKELLVTRGDGYLLDIRPEDVDVRGFERMVTAADRASTAGDYASAARLLTSALDVWRGDALSDLRPGMPLSCEITRLHEARAAATERRIDAGLRLGHHQSLLSELTYLTAREPMNEQLAGHLMLAHYRSGQQWRALDAYRQLRAKLRDELGIDPSARLQEMHHQVLRSDPALDWADTPQTSLAG